MKGTLGRHISRAAAVGALFAALQAALGAAALAWIYRGQILPPYGFFTTRVYDPFTEVAFAALARAGLTIPLLDHFLEPSWRLTVKLLPHLMAVDLLCALVLSIAVGAVARLAAGRGTVPPPRWYLRLWFAIAVTVDLAFWVSTLHFSTRSTWQQTLYHHLLRPFVLDGELASLLVASLAFAAAAAILARLTIRPAAVRKALAVAAALCLVTVMLSGGVLGARAKLEVGEANAAGRSRPLSTRPWNVLLISIDSLRADHLRCYGYGRNTSPAIDRLAAQGVRFGNAVTTTSWTLPAHLSLLTSRYALSHGVVDDTRALSVGVPTLAEVLHAAGYVTAGIVSAPYVAARYGFDRGMDEYEDVSSGYQHRSQAREAIVAPAVNRLALRWLEKHRGDRFFLFLHYFDVHYDYIPPPPYDTMFDPDYRGDVDGRRFIENPRVNRRMNRRDLEHVIALYDGEIRFTDKHVGEILRAVDELGLRDRTLVVLVSDHGEEFFEHGNKGHHRTLYEEAMRVPLIFRLPDGSLAGTVVKEQVSLVDVMPTLLELLGIPGPQGMEGRSLAAVFRGKRLRPAYVYGAFYDKRGLNIQVMERGRERKFIEHFNRITHPTQKPIEWYDLRDDPEEQRNLGGAGDPHMRRARHRLAAWLERQWRVHRAQGRERQKNVQIDEEMRERLRSLGYLAD